MKKSETAGKMRSDVASSSGSSSIGGGGGRGESVVVDCGWRRSTCGYCRSGARSSISDGLVAHSITVDDYQDLLDRGWRRSGSFLYKPEMEMTCCPSYTIRLRAADYVPSKEHLRMARRVERFLDGTLDAKKPVHCIEDQNTSKDTGSCAGDKGPISLEAKVYVSSNEKSKAEQFINYWSEKIDNVVCKFSMSGEFPCSLQLPKASVKKVSEGKRKLIVEGSEDLLFSCSIAFQIAAALRRLQSNEKGANLRLLRQNAEGSLLSPKVIAEKLASSLNQMAETSGPSIRACNGHINFYSAGNQASLDEGVQIVADSKNIATGFGGRGCCITKSSENTQRKRQKLEIRLKRSSFDPEEFALYKKYQIKVHNDAPDHVTESSYRRFLVKTPLIFVPPTGDGTVPPCGFGSFHQQYVINGQLVAVGVIDILPKCLSSKYLFWDPDFAFLSLGKYSALQEISWVKENQAYCPSLQYYYLGYYIHSCSKMRYKAAYRPSELLCPLRYQWVPFDIARPLLDREPYVVLSDFTNSQNGQSSLLNVSETSMEPRHDDIGQQDTNHIPMDEDDELIESEYESSENESGSEINGLASVIADDCDIGNILIGLKGSRMRFKDLQTTFRPAGRIYLESQLRRYIQVVGAQLSERMVYSIG